MGLRFAGDGAVQDADEIARVEHLAGGLGEAAFVPVGGGDGGEAGEPDCQAERDQGEAGAGLQEGGEAPRGGQAGGVPAGGGGWLALGVGWGYWGGCGLGHGADEGQPPVRWFEAMVTMRGGVAGGARYRPELAET